MTLTTRDAFPARSLSERDVTLVLPPSRESGPDVAPCEAPFSTDSYRVHYAISIRRKAVAPCEAPSASSYRVHYAISPELAARSQIFNALQSLYKSHNNPRDRQIADRLTALYRDALSEEETLSADSVSQFARFFLQNPSLGMPKITLTPDGTLRARWIRSSSDFAAIEFSGIPIAKFVAEIPRPGDLTARYFSGEPVEHVVVAARAVGAFLG